MEKIGVIEKIEKEKTIILQPLVKKMTAIPLLNTDGNERPIIIF